MKCRPHLGARKRRMPLIALAALLMGATGGVEGWAQGNDSGTVRVTSETQAVGEPSFGGIRAAALSHVETIASYGGQDLRILDPDEEGFQTRLVQDNSGTLSLFWSSGLWAWFSTKIPNGLYRTVIQSSEVRSVQTIMKPESGLAYLHAVQTGPEGVPHVLWSEFGYEPTKGFRLPYRHQIYLGKIVSGRLIDKTAILDDEAQQGLWTSHISGEGPRPFLRLSGRNEAMVFWQDSRDPHREAGSVDFLLNWQPRVRAYDYQVGLLGPTISLAGRSRDGMVGFLAGATTPDGAVHCGWLGDWYWYRRYERGKWTRKEDTLDASSLKGPRPRYWLAFGMGVDGLGNPFTTLLADSFENRKYEEAVWIARRVSGKWTAERWPLPEGLTVEHGTALRLVGEPGSDTIHCLFQPVERKEPWPKGSEFKKWRSHPALVHARLQPGQPGDFEVLVRDTKPNGIDFARDPFGTFHVVWVERVGDEYRLTRISHRSS